MVHISLHGVLARRSLVLYCTTTISVPNFLARMKLFEIISVIASVISGANAFPPPGECLPFMLFAWSSCISSAFSTPDTLIQGKYKIENCGEKASYVVRVLDSAMVALRRAREDALKGTSSNHGFAAMFKVAENKAFVVSMLERISELDPVIDMMPDRFIPSVPRIACVTQNTDALYPFLLRGSYENCLTFPTLASFHLPGISYIWLCPSFFDLQLEPTEPTGTHCPRPVVNFIFGSGMELYHYQNYIVIHEMVHFYLGYRSLGMMTYPCEQYTINDCITLSSTISTSNPSNYQIYIASKTLQTLHRPLR